MLQKVSEEKGWHCLKLQIEKLFIVEIKYPGQRSNGPPMMIRIGTASETGLSKVYSPKHVSTILQAASTLLGLTQGMSISIIQGLTLCVLGQGHLEFAMHRGYDLSELWMKLHSIQCFVDGLYALRLKSPPFVGYTLSNTSLTFNFCHSATSVLLSLHLTIKPYTFPYHFNPSDAKINLLMGSNHLTGSIQESWSRVKPGLNILDRIVDAASHQL